MFVNYLRVLRRRWWLVLLPLLVTAAITSVSYRPPNDPWLVRFSMQVGLQPPARNASNSFFDYNNLYVWTSSEYLTRSISDLVITSKFAEDVTQRIRAETGRELDSDKVRLAVSRDYRGTLVTAVIKWSDSDTAELIANTMERQLAEHSSAYFPQLGDLKSSPFIRLDNGKAAYDNENVRNRLDLPIRAGVALVAGLALAVLAHLFDPLLRGKQEVERMGLKVIGQIPAP